ncbi:phosphate ABC transporter permease subunit PstC [Candidatus Nitrosocosmicus franklandus]|uniref:Phosphate transport system permease protein n=1 Tax=Candidatus Nitrosocosmicus franklandianus TaxID=1798806 RepID=A0A484I8W9_9ARCH|nr:phosphate ABC transporter permease subunit PstC [Candidatus Nitrosocosmicus franklandus]VFJ14160.1 phosphate transporter subunit; membrane component of ABC superfamily [Candidatus Nitrosocosmicus franklandus]
MPLEDSGNAHTELVKKLDLRNKKSLFGDKFFKALVIGASLYTLLMVALVLFSLAEGSIPIFEKEGFNFITGTNWNAVEGRESFGALPYIIGTLVSSAIAMAIAVPISVGIAVFITEMVSKKIGTVLSFVIELLAAVPSIIYGLWALFIFRFWIRDYIEEPLHNSFGDYISIFAKAPFGLDIFTAGIVLAIMIIPIITAVSREVIKAIPHSQKEAAYALGATRWEMVKTAILPSAKTGLMGASFLGLGRAIGETMLVTLIIGNAIGLAAIPTSLFSQSQTLSSIIANEFNEAANDLHLSALIGLGLVLFIITVFINVAAIFIISKVSKSYSNTRE